MKISRLLTTSAAVLITAAALVAAGCGGKDDVPADAVAVVDGTVITKAQLDDLMGRAKKSYEGQKREFPKAGTAEFTALQGQAVLYLVQRVEYQKEAEKLNVAVSADEIDKKIVEVTKQYFGGSKATLEKQLAQQGYTDDGFRKDIEAQILSEKIFANVTKSVTVTPADIQKYYADNKAQYTIAESRDVRHILLAKKNKDGSVDYAASKAQADDVEKRLKNGEDFAKLAKELSQDPGSAANGGKLTIQKGQTVKPFEESSFSLKVNAISEPIKTEFGYHVIQAVGPVKPASTTPLATAEAAIKSNLLQQKKNEAVKAWTDGLAKTYKSKITYSPGYAPASTDTQSSGG
jgi:parvulin-like peptidyl-prolyl isomerase